MFKTALLRLTLWYLLLIVFLSTGFSAALYSVSTRELNVSQQQLEALVERSFFPSRRPPEELLAFNHARLEQVVESRNRIKWKLVYFNVFIFAAGGVASYFLARKTLQPIEENVEAQARFTSDASHELRTPLTAMKSEIEVALRAKAFNIKDARELLSSNLEEIERLKKLSTGLLKLAQNEALVEVAPCRVADITREAVKSIATVAQKRGITVTNTVGQERVIGNQLSLVELITILLDNALKYSTDNSKITITTSSRHRSQQTAIIIKDEGAGISATDIPHIFERFYRADRSRTKSIVQGYGLGLSIAKKIVEMHHGAIEVKSVLGKGSAFTVLLPSPQIKNAR